MTIKSLRSPMLTLIAGSLILGLPTLSASAQTLTRAEIAKEFIGKTIRTRRFGMNITIRYRANGTVNAKALLGSVDGTWRYSGANKVCTTFPRGPAKGTDCVSFVKLGPGKFRNSNGLSFTAR